MLVVVPKTYADCVANLAFLMVGLPVGLLCMTVSALPIFFWMSFHGRLLWWCMHYCLLPPLHLLSRQLILALCLCMHPYALFTNFAHNMSLVQQIRDANLKQPEYSAQLYTEVRCAVGKEGFWYVYVRLLVMYSFLPAWRHAFSTNPVLFRYRLHLTNQSSQTKLEKPEYMVDFLWDYILDLKGWKYDKEEVKNVRFVPSYFDNDVDHDFTDHNNVGIQLTRRSAFLVQVETLVKTRVELLKKINSGDYTVSIMQDRHPLRKTLPGIPRTVQNTAKHMGLLTVNNTDNRVGLLTVALPYNHFYHPLCCLLVEVNLVCNQGYWIEHPMLGLAHNGANLTALWADVDRIFNKSVGPYVESMATRLSGVLIS